MGIETFNYIDSLNTANPTSTDNVSEGDDHIRGIKTTLKNTFPNVNAAVNATDEELNFVDGVTSAIQTQLDDKEPADATIVKDADIGSTVQAYDADTAKTDVDQSWTGSQRGTTVTDNDGSFDMDGGNNFKCTPTGAITLTFTNITDGQSGFILLVNSGGQTVSAHTNTKVDANLLATVSTAGTYLISYFSDGTNVYLTNSAIYA